MVSRPFMFLLYYTIHHHEEYYRVLDILSDAGEQKGTISKLERKILIEADEFEVQHRRLLMPAELKRRLKEAMKAINFAFGGELVVNKGVVCKDGVGTRALRRLLWENIDSHDEETDGENLVECGTDHEEE